MAAPSKKKRSRSRTKPHPGSTNHARRDHRSPVAAPKPATLRDWIGAARLRTLPLAVTPILIGTGAALLIERPMHWVIALACLVVSVSLQIGVNYANDYS
ncbi:MAG: 1,4-dihydroxy-2-naphthoate polyprenyltransferase, partial [Actinomycetota bacterium]|nr:1,4-dihydroxy-2-naphthoate polyprenyltransferase [Actinomycetota bacterium]